MMFTSKHKRIKKEIETINSDIERYNKIMDVSTATLALAKEGKIVLTQEQSNEINNAITTCLSEISHLTLKRSELESMISIARKLDTATNIVAAAGLVYLGKLAYDYFTE